MLTFIRVAAVLVALSFIDTPASGESLRGSDDPLDDPEENRIVGGTDAAENEFPFYCDIRVGERSDHWCGGTLLPDGSHVLTAAHCLEGYEDSILNGEVWCNAYQVKSQGNAVSRDIDSLHFYDQDARDRRFRYESFYIRWRRNFVPVDAAIITLARRITPDEIPRDDFLTCSTADIPDNYEMTTMGMGTISEDYQLPDLLQKVTLYSVSCSPSYSSSSAPQASVICAQNTAPGIQNACRGDSGSAIYKDGKHIGIDSFGNGPCTTPTGFARSGRICDWACYYDGTFCQ